jgi:WD40 repeat protein
LWDIEAGQDAITVNGHGDVITSISWNYNGSLFVSTARDRQLRIVDPRNGGIVAVSFHSFNLFSDSKNSNCLIFFRFE